MNNVFFFNWQEQQTQDRKLDKVMISSIMSSRTPRWDLWQWSLWSRISQSWTEGFTGNAIPVENPYQLMDWCRNDERIEPEIFGFSPFFFWSGGGFSPVMCSDSFFRQSLALEVCSFTCRFAAPRMPPCDMGSCTSSGPWKVTGWWDPFPKIWYSCWLLGIMMEYPVYTPWFTHSSLVLPVHNDGYMTHDLFCNLANIRNSKLCWILILQKLYIHDIHIYMIHIYI